jgi:hypothetical protein
LFYELTNTGGIITKEDVRKAIELVNPEFPEVMIEEFTITYLPILSVLYSIAYDSSTV